MDSKKREKKTRRIFRLFVPAGRISGRLSGRLLSAASAALTSPQPTPQPAEGEGGKGEGGGGGLGWRHLKPILIIKSAF